MTLLAVAVTRARSVILAVAVAAALVIGALASGFVRSSDVTLVVMGFDPDRARLITALVVGALPERLPPARLRPEPGPSLPGPL